MSIAAVPNGQAVNKEFEALFRELVIGLVLFNPSIEIESVLVQISFE
jgi:hypothetical protein